jgi:signal transduction histidine kinase/CheY-like chemotaxis protein
VTFPAELFDTPINDDKGNLIGIVEISTDITERKEAEAELIDANNRAISEYIRLLEKLATLGQKLGSARDLSGIFSAVLEFANASMPCSALLISLYDKEQSTRKLVYMWYNGKELDISDFESFPVGNGAVGQAIKSGKVTIVNDYLKAAGEKSTYVSYGFDEDSREPRSIITAPMKIMGNVIGAIEVQSYEISAYTQEHATAMQMAANLAANAIENVRLLEQERINAEQMRLSQKLESVGRLAGGIAHDFNNMLTAINGYSDLTLRRLKDDDPLRANIEEIKKAGERSALLTHQLLAFSRKQVLKPKVLDINQVITEVSTMLKRLIGEDIHLITILAPKLGTVEADPGQLTQVIINLAVNARDAMTRGGDLTIETNNVYLDAEYAAHHMNMRPGSYVQLVVSDSGTGMTDEIQEHIFEPFYTTKEIGKGTGLGLATVYGIIKQSGGYIWVYSEVEHGTTFKIYLPRVDEEVTLFEENSEPRHAPKGTETILLVEDEEIVRNLSRQILETCGYKVKEAGDGIEALSICRQPDCKIDLLLTDVVMPKMSGRQLVEHLADLRPEIKVLYMSGYTDDAIVRQGVIQTGTNFIQKPFTFNTLAQKVRASLDAKNGMRNG